MKLYYAKFKKNTLKILISTTIFLNTSGTIFSKKNKPYRFQNNYISPQKLRW